VVLGQSHAEAYRFYTDYMNSARNIDPEAGAGWRRERDKLIALAKKYERGARRYQEALYKQFKRA
jgi:hypothetical protein